MTTLNQQTMDATNVINNQSDSGAPSMSLGAPANTINLDAEKETYKSSKPVDAIAGAQPHEPKEKKQPPEEKTHGELRQELEQIYKQIETKQNDLEFLEKWLEKKSKIFTNPKERKKLEELILKYTNQKPNYLKDYATTSNYDEWKNKNIPNVIEQLQNELGLLYNSEKEITFNSEYDPRDYGEIREDEATQRKVDDYIAAGLNPAAVSGFYGGGGGGTMSSGQKDDEERKKRKRERELAEQQKKQARIDAAMQMVKLLGGMTAGVGGTMLYGNALRDSANIRAQGMSDSANIRADSNKWIQQVKTGTAKDLQMNNYYYWDKIRRNEELTQKDRKYFKGIY